MVCREDTVAEERRPSATGGEAEDLFQEGKDLRSPVPTSGPRPRPCHSSWHSSCPRPCHSSWHSSCPRPCHSSWHSSCPRPCHSSWHSSCPGPCPLLLALLLPPAPATAPVNSSLPPPAPCPVPNPAPAPTLSPPPDPTFAPPPAPSPANSPTFASAPAPDASLAPTLVPSKAVSATPSRPPPPAKDMSLEGGHLGEGQGKACTLLPMSSFHRSSETVYPFSRHRRRRHRGRGILCGGGPSYATSKLSPNSLGMFLPLVPGSSQFASSRSWDGVGLQRGGGREGGWNGFLFWPFGCGVLQVAQGVESWGFCF